MAAISQYNLYECPISLKPITDAVVEDGCGHTFQKEAIEEHVQRLANKGIKPFCPLTRQPFTKLIPNRMVNDSLVAINKLDQIVAQNNELMQTIANQHRTITIQNKQMMAVLSLSFVERYFPTFLGGVNTQDVILDCLTDDEYDFVVQPRGINIPLHREPSSQSLGSQKNDNLVHIDLTKKV